MKRPLAYITAAWSGDPCEATEQAAKYCRAVYEAGFSSILMNLREKNKLTKSHLNGTTK